MGYPATGLEGFYRNRREDAKRFLDHRHKDNYWVFNFCPVKENAYPASVFEGRVSRYPFPDHQCVCPFCIVRRVECLTAIVDDVFDNFVVRRRWRSCPWSRARSVRGWTAPRSASRCSIAKVRIAEQ